MGRRKAAQNCSISPWLSAKQDCKEGRYIQVGNTLMLSKTFQTLSNGAKWLYLCMTLESGGHREFTFPQTAAKKYGMNPRSFWRYVDELVEQKFVKRLSNANLRKANDYEFITEWKADKQDK